MAFSQMAKLGGDYTRLSRKDRQTRCGPWLVTSPGIFRTSMMGNKTTSFTLYEREPIPYDNEALPSVTPFYSHGCYASKTGMTKKATDVSAYKCANLCDGVDVFFFGLEKG